MASVALAVAGVVSTSNLTAYTTASFTPPAGELLLAVGGLTTNTATDQTVTDSLGGSWTKIRRQVKVASGDLIEVWVRNSLTSASAMTVSFNRGASTCTGGTVTVLRVASMTLLGSAAVRSQGGEDNQAAAGTPAPVLGQAAVSANPVIMALYNADQPPAVAVRAGYTDRFTSSYNTPGTGVRVISIDSGETASTLTWGGTSPTAYSTIALELDAGSGAVAITAQPVVVPSQAVVQSASW